MKLNLLQFMAFAFMLGWVGMEVMGGGYNEKLVVAIGLAIIVGYLNNAHGVLWRNIKRMFKSK